MILSPNAELITDIARIDILERNGDGSVKTARIVNIDEVLLLRKTDGGTVKVESYWKRQDHEET